MFIAMKWDSLTPILVAGLFAKAEKLTLQRGCGKVSVSCRLILRDTGRAYSRLVEADSWGLQQASSWLMPRENGETLGLSQVYPFLREMPSMSKKICT